MTRKTSKMCSIRRIVEHWEEACYKHETEKLPIYLDLGEPTCFACGESWQGEFDGRRGFTGWAKAPLERAHIIPRSLGGADDDPSNFVMLCDRCHPQNPHTTSRTVYMKWLHSLKPNKEALLKNLIKTWLSDKEDLKIATAIWSDRAEIEQFYEWRSNNTSFHFGTKDWSWDDNVPKMFPDLIVYIESIKNSENKP